MEPPTQLSPNLLRGLSDKIYERRKSCALEIERLVRDLYENGDYDSINNITSYLAREFAFSHFASQKNGGLIGLAAISIALGMDSDEFLDDIIPPVLACFSDQDAKVRYYACEAMYNIAKNSKFYTLRFFNEIFDALSNMASDPDPNNMFGTTSLNNMMKTIIKELKVDTLPNQHYDGKDIGIVNPVTNHFSLPRFVPLLSERIKTLNPFTRKFIVDWIHHLASIPDLELVTYLPKFLDGLFLFLADSSTDVATSTYVLFQDFLKEIKDAATSQNLSDLDPKANPYGSGSGQWQAGQGVHVDFVQILHILIPHLGHSLNPIQAMALHWVEVFSEVAKPMVLACMPELVNAILPCLAHTDDAIRSKASSLNATLYWLVCDTPLSGQFRDDATLGNVNSVEEEVVVDRDTPKSRSSKVESISDKERVISPGIKRSESLKDRSSSTLSPKSKVQVEGVEDKLRSLSLDSIEVNTLPSDDVITQPEVSLLKIDYQSLVQLLSLQLQTEHEVTRSESLEWLKMLHRKAPHHLFLPGDGMFPTLLKVLSDPSEQVVTKDLQLLAQISSHLDSIVSTQNNQISNFYRFMQDLIDMFKSDQRLLEQRASLIIQQLCMALSSEKIFLTLADILDVELDLPFALLMVQHLNTILLTSPLLSPFRNRLKSQSKDSSSLFLSMYPSFCHSPVSALSLCLITQNYELASSLLTTIFPELEITVQFLIQLDRLVLMLESPVFTYLRLQLLEPDKFPYLVKSLYAILMLLPQSSAFTTLKNRLSCIPNYQISLNNNVNPTPDTKSLGSASPSIAARSKRILASKTPSPTPSFDTKELNLPKMVDLLNQFKSVQKSHETMPTNMINETHNQSTKDTFTRVLSNEKSKYQPIRRVDSPLSHLRNMPKDQNRVIKKR